MEDTMSPFVGGGALLFKVAPKDFVINDFNSELVQAYRCFSDEENLTKLIKKLKYHEKHHSDVHYYEVRSMDKEHGKFHYYEETNVIFNNILEKINQVKAIFVYGNAGSGKSVLTLRLIAEKKDKAKFLLLNSKLYNVLAIGGPLYSSGQTTFNTSHFIEELNSDSFVIVDECQRLSFNQIKTIIEKSKCAIFFGNEKQACFSSITNLNCKELDKTFKKIRLSLLEHNTCNN